MTEELLGNSMAAQTLSELDPSKTPEQWAAWLQNNRNTTRSVAYRIPLQRLAGGVFYRREDLVAYLEWDKSRQLGTMKLSPKAKEALNAIGFNEKGGSSTGRRFDVTMISHQIDEATGTPFIQLILNNPLLVYRLPLSQALEVADLLIKEAGGKRLVPEYTKVVDNEDVLIKRKA